MRVVTIVGARPQFIKAFPVSRALRVGGHTEVLIHTGQHYDANMSRVFFEELGIPEPEIHLGVGSLPQAEQIAGMLTRLDEALAGIPDIDAVLVFGDTNSTLAGALAASRRGMYLAHVEAGLRSFNRRMPEEHNRVLTDHLADVLFCPTPAAMRNLEREGLAPRAHRVGDTMAEAMETFLPVAGKRSTILRDLGLVPGTFYLATVHRPYNTEDPARLGAILEAFAGLDRTVVFTVHPATRKRMHEFFGERNFGGNVRAIDPVGYLDMLILQKSARAVLTDSGGVQKEAYWLGVPCVTLRPETEWVETVESGWNRLVNADTARILEAVQSLGCSAKGAPLKPSTAGSSEIVRILGRRAGARPGEERYAALTHD